MLYQYLHLVLPVLPAALLDGDDGFDRVDDCALAALLRGDGEEDKDD